MASVGISLRNAGFHSHHPSLSPFQTDKSQNNCCHFNITWKPSGGQRQKTEGRARWVMHSQKKSKSYSRTQEGKAKSILQSVCAGAGGEARGGRQEREGHGCSSKSKGPRSKQGQYGNKTEEGIK